MVKYKVTLTQEERVQLNDIISKGSHSAQLYRTAYILLNCDEGEYAVSQTGSASLPSKFIFSTVIARIVPGVLCCAIALYKKTENIKTNITDLVPVRKRFKSSFFAIGF